MVPAIPVWNTTLLVNRLIELDILELEYRIRKQMEAGNLLIGQGFFRFFLFQRDKVALSRRAHEHLPNQTLAALYPKDFGQTGFAPLP